MRALAIHNTVMQLMVSTLNRQQQQSAAIEMAGDKQAHRNSLTPGDEVNMSGEQSKVLVTQKSVLHIQAVYNE